MHNLLTNCMQNIDHSEARSVLSSKWSLMPRLPYDGGRHLHRIILGEPTVGKTYASREGLVYDEDKTWNLWCYNQGLQGWLVVGSAKVRAKYRADVIDELALKLHSCDVAVWEERLALELSLMTGSQIFPVVTSSAQEYARRTLDRYTRGEKPRMPDTMRIASHLETDHDRRVAQWVKRFGFCNTVGDNDYLIQAYDRHALRCPSLIWLHSYKGVTPDKAYRVHIFIEQHTRDYHIAVTTFDRSPGSFICYDPSTRKTVSYLDDRLNRSALRVLVPCEVYGYKPTSHEIGLVRRDLIPMEANHVVKN